MSHLNRGRLLYDQERYQEAEKELALAVSEEPDYSYPQSLLALCFSEQGKLKEALAMAKKAVALTPEDGFAHHALALVYLEQDMSKLGEAAAKAALQIDPDDEDYHSVLAYAYAQQSRWKACLAAAERGLEIDPEHESCIQFRTQALSFLGRRDEAAESAHLGVAQDPSSPLAHASLGWVALRRGEQKEAENHFKEALRLDPNDEWAREGLLETLRNRFLPYRWSYAFFVWVGRFPRNIQWGIMVGLYISCRIVLNVSKANPHLLPFALPLLIVNGFLVFMSWFGEPLVNITLLPHPLGRLAMGRRARLEAWVMGGFLLAALGFGVAAAFNQRLVFAAVLSAFVFIILGMLARIKSSRDRSGIFIVVAVLSLLAVLASLFYSSPSRDEREALRQKDVAEWRKELKESKAAPTPGDSR